MTATILDGRGLAAELRGELGTQVKELQAQGITPTMGLLQADEEAETQSYVRQISRVCREVGVALQVRKLDAEATTDDAVAYIARFNSDPAISGILVTMPLPKRLDVARITAAIDPEKDIDGATPINAGLLLMGRGNPFPPATPAGGMELLQRAGIPLQGREAVVVGRSAVVGKPLALLLLAANATVTICHSRTSDLGSVTRRADILCVATGKANLITTDMVKPGAVVLDFGINYENGKLTGDVDFEQVKEVAGAITPVPGGTGPLTTVLLAKHTIEAAQRLRGG